MTTSPVGHVYLNTSTNLSPDSQTLDRQRVSSICELLGVGNGSLRQAIGTTPSKDNIVQALNLFREIKSSLAKMQAFESSIFSGDFYSNIPKKFYDELSPELKIEFKHQIWVANGQCDNGLGEGFGQHIVDNALVCNPLAVQAARAMRLN